MTTTPPDPSVLRSLPSIDALLRDDAVQGLPPGTVRRVAREVLDGLRRDLTRGDAAARAEAAELVASPSAHDGGVVARVVEACRRSLRPRHRRVVNATGIVLHTGLGRAPLAEPARRAVLDAAGASVVEVDPVSGQRNQREEAVAALLTELTGTEAALVVNNNAAACNLMLRALAEDREVVISRGELVEIGGGFRMPDVMAMAGCRMVEVGATNRTHLRDYEEALSEDTAMFLKVHTSNYRVEGFAGVPDLGDLVALGRRRGVLVCEDLGSGLLVRDPIPGLEDEPRVHDSLAADPDLICFSGDKLLGGPQCGIFVGRAEVVRALRRHSMYRAFRCDKLTLSALEATLRIHRDGEPLREIPGLRALSTPPRELRMRAERLAALLADLGAEVVDSESYVGSGANPARPLPCSATAFADPTGALAERLRTAEPVGVWGRVTGGRLHLEARTLVCEDLEEVAGHVRAALGA